MQCANELGRERAHDLAALIEKCGLEATGVLVFWNPNHEDRSFGRVRVPNMGDFHLERQCVRVSDYGKLRKGARIAFSIPKGTRRRKPNSLFSIAMASVIG